MSVDSTSRVVDVRTSTARAHAFSLKKERTALLPPSRELFCFFFFSSRAEGGGEGEEGEGSKCSAHMLTRSMSLRYEINLTRAVDGV